MIFNNVLNTEDSYFLEAIAIYNDSFPDNERQPINRVRDRVKSGKSRLIVGLLDNKVVCIALWSYLEESEFVLLDYLAVNKEYRNQSFGTELFLYLLDRVKKENKYLILEVEDYAFSNDIELRKRRINFYLNNGAYIINDCSYLLPPLNGSDPTEMLLMIAPKYMCAYLLKSNLESLVKSLYIEIYERKENDILLKSLLERLPERSDMSNERIV